MKEQICYLLIGNSRWHWALKKEDEWSFIDTPPNLETFHSLESSLLAWAAVGKIPTDIDLNPALKLNINQIPLMQIPSWIGIDRALGAWAAFQKFQLTDIHPNGFLVADAGTVLSITRITANGEFAGGQLIAGLHLQLSSMINGTENLIDPGRNKQLSNNPFPEKTEDAMLRGSVEALVGVIIAAHNHVQGPLWLCGGDSSILFKELKERGINVLHSPNLVLEGMINLKS